MNSILFFLWERPDTGLPSTAVDESRYIDISVLALSGLSAVCC